MNTMLPASRLRLGRHHLIGVTLALAVVSGGCSDSLEPEIAPTLVDADRLLYERGVAALEEEDWTRAREYFVQVRDNYPQSEFRAESRLGVGDTFVGQGTSVAYVSATAEFRDFLSLYPTHPRAAYAQFKLGQINFFQMRDPERDQSYTVRAIADFEEFIQRYPNSELMPEVRDHLRQARDRLSESEVVVGRYYYRNNWLPGAVSRLESVLDEDPAYSGRDAVYFYLGSAYHQQGRSVEALAMLQRVLDEFPESELREELDEILPEVRAAAADQEVAAAAAQGADDGDNAVASAAESTR